MAKQTNPAIYSVWNGDYKEFHLKLLNDEQIAYSEKCGIPYKKELVTKAKLEGKQRADNGYIARLFRGENGKLYEVFHDSSAREAILPTLKFKEGDKVVYFLGGRPWFSAIVKKAVIEKGKKPYTLTPIEIYCGNIQKGSEVFSNEGTLKPIEQ